MKRAISGRLPDMCIRSSASSTKEPPGIKMSSPRLTAVSNIGTTSSVGGNVSEVTGSSNREFLFENIDNTVIHVDVGLQPLLLTDLIEDKKEEEGE